MASCEFKADGIKALKERLLNKKMALKSTLDIRLMQLAEEAVTHAKENKGYRDHTANLKNSISFALYYNGELITSHEGQIPKPDNNTQGQAQVSDNLIGYASQEGVVNAKGYSLIVVAGMNYGRYVEDKGYNVLYLTKHFLHDEMKKILEEAVKL